MSTIPEMKTGAAAPAAHEAAHATGTTPGLRPLADDDRAEVLAFLSAGTVDTIYMNGLIRDNGVVSAENRGTFYGAYDTGGALEGVALIGHFMLIEARGDEALAAFARLARRHRSVHMMVGAPDKLDLFFSHYGRGGQEPRLICRELFFELRAPDDAEPEPGLRLATEADLELIAPVQALMIREESGVNPLVTDPAGFRRRLARRIEMGRIWVLVEGGRLLFKTDLMADTPEAAYIEGVHVHPDERGKGLGRRCLSQLGRTLLARSGAVCLVVNEQNRDAQGFFLKAGYRLRGLYDSVYLKPGAGD